VRDVLSQKGWATIAEPVRANLLWLAHRLLTPYRGRGRTMPIHHPSTMTEPKSAEAPDFFARLCPTVLELRRQAAGQLAGKYGFKLRGTGGGAWTVDLDAGAVSSVLEEVSVCLELDASDFNAMLRGTLDMKKALSEPNRIRCEGDLALLNNLALILRPAGPKALPTDHDSIAGRR
jgi:hypothetical protein